MICTLRNDSASEMVLVNPLSSVTRNNQGIAAENDTQPSEPS